MSEEGRLSVGLISCSGEACPGGTISRLATQKVLRSIRPGYNFVTICLPLFMAGGEEERNFARDYPTITIDGCEKCCALKATEALSGPVSGKVVVTDLIAKEDIGEGTLSIRELTGEQKAMVDHVAAAILEQVTKIKQEG
ncbi:putative zinc-binding protein [Neomoorella humiferrea]|uniref:DGC domain protein n=1 Tax=Neomoorella humiferrea TaxID=676965 RepID=A0A2T0ARU3_9FIRM|nr:putative zinc-binding protein [Moorella humiferrea]PRR72574.1 DGC domain protein [Moorella humiferrea]